MEGRDRIPGVGRHLRQTLLTGLVVLLPLFITLWLLTVLFQVVDGAITPWVRRVLQLTGAGRLTEPAFFDSLAPAIGIVITIVLIYVAGLLSTNLLGSKILSALDGLMLKIPGVRAVYGGSKQLLEALSPKGKGGFSRVVLVEYPRKGLYTVGFVTRDRLPSFPVFPAGPMASVFLPTTPNPTSGWVAVLPADDLITLPISVEEGVKLVVSGGIVIPERWEPALPGEPGRSGTEGS
jgi:uncharacterized membrane protein